MKYLLLFVMIFLSSICYAQDAFVSTADNEIRRFDLAGNCNSSFFSDCNMATAAITDIAMDAYGKMYVLRGDSLFLIDINNPGAGCSFVTSFGSYHVKAIEIGPDAKLYAVERHILAYNFTTSILEDLGEIPKDIPDVTDIVFYMTRMFMSAINGSIYSLDYIDPKKSALYYNPKITNLSRLLMAPARCFNATSDDLRMFAFENAGNGKTVTHIIDVENKITYYNYCVADIRITGSAGFHPASVITGQIPSLSVMIKPATCDKIADGRISINMNAIPTNAGAYSFSLNNSEPDIAGVFANLKGGNYQLSIHNNLGCTNDSTVTVPVQNNDCKESLFIPQAFTPDGNGNNDVFRVKSLLTYPDFRLQVYDRNGQIVFQSNSISNGWDGKVKGTLQTTGVYIWLIRYTNLDGQTQYKRGQVLLIR